jgi:hypothetical protein
MTNQTQNELGNLLLLATQDPSRRDDFYRTLMKSTIYVVGTTDAKTDVGGNIHLPQGSKISILKWAKQDGSPIIPFFSSLEEMEKAFDKPQPYMALPCQSFFEQVLGSNLVLDPLEPYRKEFSPEEIKYLLQTFTNSKFVEKTADAPSDVLLGQPADYPTKTVESLKRVLTGYPQVKRAYLVQMQDRSMNEKPQLIVGLEGQGDLEPAFKAANSAILASPPKQPIGLFRIEENDQGLSSYLVEETTPFYQ